MRLSGFPSFPFSDAIDLIVYPIYLSVKEQKVTKGAPQIFGEL
jgi:hypothetical protein